MQSSNKQARQLLKIIETAQQLLVEVKRGSARAISNLPPGRGRRRGKELVAFKKAIKAERKAGASVAELARKHGVTPSYLYQLR